MADTQSGSDMSRVIAYHLVMGAYGFWLPNDPRGSGSWYVGSGVLFRHGPATHADGERSVAGRPHDAAARRAAKRDLKYRPVRFGGDQARCIAMAFGESATKEGMIVYACAVLPDHAHLVVARHPRLSAEQMMIRLKASASRHLRREGLHPFLDKARPDGQLPKVWARDGRHRFLYRPAQVRERIDYANGNPMKHGFKRQHWSFVVPYAG
jgi:REP element-mobilizing transposase RayT